MVRRLQRNEYLKRYDNMTAAERAAYESRVGEWIRSEMEVLMAKTQESNARLQNIQQVSTAWNDWECQAFEEGARLLSALTNLTDTWLPDMLYVKSAKRVIGNMYAAINAVVAWGPDRMDSGQENSADVQTTPAPPDSGGEAAANEGSKNSGGEAAADKSYTVKAGGAVSVSVTPETGSSVTSQQTDVTKYPDPGVTPARPKHVDQYVHLLPQKTQERAAQLKDLYRELDETRRKMGLLMDDETAKDDDRAVWAKKATSIDNKIRKVLDELDAEWTKLVEEGRVVVDDLGNARVIDNNREPINNNQAAAAEEPAGLTSEQKARRRSIRKWLVDTRRGNGDEENRADRVIKWHENFEELWKYDGDKVFEDEKVMAAAAHYGIDLADLRQRIKTDDTNLTD